MPLGQEMGMAMASFDACGVTLCSWEGPAPLIHIFEQKPVQVGYGGGGRCGKQFTTSDTQALSRGTGVRVGVERGVG